MSSSSFNLIHLLLSHRCHSLALLTHTSNGGYAQQTSVHSVKQVLTLPVYVFCICFVKYRAVLLKITLNQTLTLKIYSKYM